MPGLSNLPPDGRVDVGDIFKTIVWDVLVKLALARLAVALPFLAWPVVGPLVGIIVGIVADELYEALRMAVQLEVIVMKTEAQRRAFAEAAVNLKAIAANHTKDSPEYKEAHAKHLDAFRKLVSFG